MTRIVILAFGTRGDVDPVTGLGAELAAHGFDVAVAAQARTANSSVRRASNSATCRATPKPKPAAQRPPRTSLTVTG